jgi:hypothetical protein
MVVAPEFAFFEAFLDKNTNLINFEKKILRMQQRKIALEKRPMQV